MICLKCFYFDVGRKFTDLHQVEIAASENFDEKKFDYRYCCFSKWSKLLLKLMKMSFEASFALEIH